MRYRCIPNFIQVSFSFWLILGLGLGSVIGLGFKVRFGIDNLKNVLKYLIGGAAGRVDIPVR